MNPWTYAFISFVIVAMAGFLAGVAVLRWWPVIQRQRFMAPAAVPGNETILRFDEEESEGWRKTLERLARPFERGDKARLSRYRRRLVWAGYHDPNSVKYFVGSKVAMAILAGLAYPLYGLASQTAPPRLLIVSYVLAVVGFFLPDYWLGKRVKARQQDVLNGLPDALDLLMVCVESGMGFDAAVARVAEQPEVRKSPLHQEMLRMHLEMRAGRPREEALRALGDRTGVDDVRSLVGAFIQTDRMGTPLGKTLRIYSDATRVQRRHRAEKQAYLAPLKMIFPTVAFLMPAFFLVALAPSFLKLMDLLRSFQ